MINMFRFLQFSCAAVCVAIFSACGSNRAETLTSADDDVFFADPTIINLDGRYYLAGTQGSNPPGFTVLSSTDLQNWSPASADTIPNLTPGEKVFGTKGFWAPQFVPTDSCVYMFYTANEQIALAKADSINGTYIWDGTAIDDSEKNIDPFLFTDTDGRHYLYHVRFDHGNFLWVGEFDFNSGHFVEGTLHPVFRNDQPWEHTLAYESDPIMEGPTVVRLGDKYYLFYSANHYMSPDYAVGYATAASPLGPWTKNPENPIIHRNIVGERGSGHGDVFTDNDGNLRYVYHVHNSDTVPNPRRTRIVSMNIEKPEDSSLPVKITVDSATIINPSGI